MSSSLIIAAASVAIAALNAIKRRQAYARQQPLVQESQPGLPPLSRAEALEVMLDAEKAAIRQALGDAPTPNPHSEGTRAHIIWASHHGATLLDWEP